MGKERMGLMKKIIIISLLSVVGLMAQGSPNSVAQAIATASVAATGSVAISGNNSIGQNSHQVLAYATNTQGHTCTSMAGPISLAGSIDGVLYKQLSVNAVQPLAFVPTLVAYVGFATGVYPYLKVTWTNSDTTDCALTIWYTGSVSPQAYTGSPRVVNDQFSYATINVSASGDNDITTSCPGISLNAGSGVLVLYGLYLYNPSAANTIVLKLGSNLTGSNAYTTMLTLTNFAQNAQFTGMPFTGKPHYVAYQTTSGFQNIRLTLTNATEVDGYAVYRCE